MGGKVKFRNDFSIEKIRTSIGLKGSTKKGLEDWYEKHAKKVGIPANASYDDMLATFLVHYDIDARQLEYLKTRLLQYGLAEEIDGSENATRRLQ